MVRKIKVLLICVTACIAITGCDTKIQPDSKSAGTYSTQTPMTALEYSIYMNKQITVYANQLSSRMSMVKNSTDNPYEHETDLAEESLKIMTDTLEEVTVTKPAETAEDDRETTIEAMQTAVDHMQQYVDALNNQEDVSAFADVFQNDFNALTGLANLYYQ